MFVGRRTAAIEGKAGMKSPEEQSAKLEWWATKSHTHFHLILAIILVTTLTISSIIILGGLFLTWSAQN
jgi:hypothetical protein